MTFRLSVCLMLLVLTQGLFSQLSEQDLQNAVASQQCSQLASALDTAQLVNENMKFNGAICFYRNGQPDRALTLFREIKAMKSQRWRGALFWEAKINATLHKDSLAIAMLQSLPAGFLNFKLLAQTEFKDLAKTNKIFAEMKSALEPGFNIWTSALVCVAAIGFIIGIILLFGRSRISRGEKWLAVVMFSFALILTSYLTMWTRYAVDFPYLRNAWPFLTLLVGPSVYFYLKDAFKEEYTRKEILYHFLVPCISFLLTLPAILGDFGVQLNLPADLVQIGSSQVLLCCHILFYTVLIHFICQNEWQVDANIRIWSRILSWGMKLYAFAFLSYFVLASASFFNPQWDYAISLVMSLGVLVIAYMGILQKRIFNSESIETFLPVQKYKSSSLTPGASESIKFKLERLMIEQEVFKENELRLDDLAAYLAITRHQLSQVINEHYRVNFFELINKYRVEYVKKILADPAFTHYTIIQIAYDAGFNNKASFNRYFKQEIGMTPSAYRVKEEVKK